MYSIRCTRWLLKSRICRGYIWRDLPISPCLLWDEAAGKVLPTPNLHTLVQARDQLAKSGIAIEQLNAPSATSCTSLPLLAEYGVTHTEPGHALTGTIPANQQGDQP